MDFLPQLTELALYAALFYALYWALRLGLNARLLRSFVSQRAQIRAISKAEAPIFLQERAALAGPELEALGFEDDGPDEIRELQIGPDYRWNWRHAEAGTTVSLGVDVADPQMPQWVVRTLLEDGTAVVTSNLVGAIAPLPSPGVLWDSRPRHPFESLWQHHLARVQAQVEASGATPRLLDAAGARAENEAAAERAWAVSTAATDRYVATTEGGLRFRWSYLLRRGVRESFQHQRAIQAAANTAPATPSVPYSPAAQVELDVQLAHRLEALRQARRLKPRGRLLVSTVSLLGFAAFMAWRDDLQFALLLTGALLFHELGHIAAMRLFGSRDTSLLFIPLFGGAAVQNDRPALKPWQEVFILLAGPVPGLVIGFGLLGALFVLPDAALPLWADRAAWVLIGLNAFNLLLPILPLDGGQLLNVTLLLRFPYVGVLFKAVSSLALAALGWFSGSYVIGLLGLFMLTRLGTDWRLAGALRDLRRAAKADGFQSAEEEPWLRRILQRLRESVFPPGKDVARVLEANRLVQILRQPLAGFGTVLLTLAGWSLPFWLPFAGLPLVKYFGREEFAKAQAEARVAGLPGVTELESTLRKRLAAVPPTEDARDDYGAAISNRGRGEAQASGMIGPETWEALKRGAARKFWPRARPGDGAERTRRLQREGLDPSAIAELLGRRLEQVTVADDTAALREVSQLARRIFDQLAASPRSDEAQALPEFSQAWARGIERALVLRAEKNRPISAEQAAILARDLPLPEALSSRVVPTYPAFYAQAESGWAQSLTHPIYASGQSARAQATDLLLRLLSPSNARTVTEFVRDSVRVSKQLTKGGDPWGRSLQKPPFGADRGGGAAIWSTHARTWADASMRLDLARGALAWHAIWAQSGTPPGVVSELRASWFQGPTPHPLSDRLWRLDTRGPRDQRFIFDLSSPTSSRAVPKPAGVPDDSDDAEDELEAWELTKLSRMER